MKKMKFVLCLAMSVSFLAGCGESVPSDWQYSFEDAANFNIVDSEILKTDDNNVKILRIMHSEILADEIKDDDFLIFDYDSLIKDDPSEGYFSYQDIKGCSVKSIKHEVNEDDYTIDVYFEGNQNEWLALGQDQYSVFANPGFTDLEKHDFSFGPTSLLAKRHFPAIDTTKIGIIPE